MSEKISRATLHQVSPGAMTDLSDQELLDLYLALSGKQRDEKFADTARAAEIAGLARRTIQMWIEIGAIRAILIGKQYRVSIDSLTDYLKGRNDRLAT
ncbi:MAG: helix-turn-helix domain-containing protein [Blastocatellia bacterium]|nr:helix-turn-helix domain-containing protein [Blastocatellia bacterium]